MPAERDKQIIAASIVGKDNSTIRSRNGNCALTHAVASRRWSQTLRLTYKSPSSAGRPGGGGSRGRQNLSLDSALKMLLSMRHLQQAHAGSAVSAGDALTFVRLLS